MSWNSPGTPNNIINACGTPPHIYQLWGQTGGNRSAGLDRLYYGTNIFIFHEVFFFAFWSQEVVYWKDYLKNNYTFPFGRNTSKSTFLGLTILLSFETNISAFFPLTGAPVGQVKKVKHYNYCVKVLSFQIFNVLSGKTIQKKVVHGSLKTV